MNIKKQLMEMIGFLNWAEVKPEDVQQITFEPGKNYWEKGGQVFLSPDVHSLHLLWTWPEDQEACHEIADYPDDNEISLEEWLSNEIFDDSWDVISLKNQTAYDIMSDFKEMTRENTPIVALY